MTTAAPGTNPFGVMSWVEDMSLVPKRVNGARRVAESLARRFATDRGHCPGAPNAGLNLADRKGEVTNPRDVATMRAEIHAEAMKDRRVDRVTVVADIDTKTKSETYVIRAFGPLGLSSLTITRTADGTFISIE